MTSQAATKSIWITTLHVLSGLILMLLSMAGAFGSTEQDLERLFGRSEPYMQFFDQFKAAVINGDKNSVASLIRYPIAVKIYKTEQLIRSKEEFVAKYDQIMNKNVVEAVSAQDKANLFVNYKGIMFGKGQIWYSGICLDKDCNSILVKVIAINP